MLYLNAGPAALGRLCVETHISGMHHPKTDPQPPSGGCVLKRVDQAISANTAYDQPPSGGCVLKRCVKPCLHGFSYPAALGRLCVETRASFDFGSPIIPAALGRLCVETLS